MSYRLFRVVRQYSKSAMNSSELPEVFRPPVNRAMRELDRGFFQKTVPIAAATVFEDRNLSAVRSKIQNAGNLLGVFSIKAVVPDETVPGRKCVLLRPGISATGLHTSVTVCKRTDNGVRSKDLVSDNYGPRGEQIGWTSSLRPEADLRLLDNAYVSDCFPKSWLPLTFLDNILEATLPEFDDEEKETPAGFAQVGHVGKHSVYYSLVNL
jgi:hypothetical protein